MRLNERVVIFYTQLLIAWAARFFVTSVQANPWTFNLELREDSLFARTSTLWYHSSDPGDTRHLAEANVPQDQELRHLAIEGLKGSGASR